MPRKTKTGAKAKPQADSPRRVPRYRIVLYARGLAPDLLGTQRLHAQAAARLLLHLTQERSLPFPDAFKPLGAALAVLLRPGGTPLMPAEPSTVPLLF